MISKLDSRVFDFFKECTDKYRDITSTNIVDAFQRVAHAYPDNIAVRYQDVSLTYGQVDYISDCIAQGLLDDGIGPQDVVGICLEKSHKFIVSIIGILKAGCVYLPMSKSYPSKRIQDIISISGMSAIIVENGPDAHFKNIRCRYFDELSGTKTHNKQYVKIHHDNLAYIIFTSGSTGVPKGIAVKHSNVINLMFAMQSGMIKQSAANLNNVAVVSSFTFDLSVGQIYYALLYGKTLVIIDDEMKNSMEYITCCMNSFNIDLIEMTPSFFRLFIDYIEQSCSLSRFPGHFITCGEALPASLVKRFYNINNTEHVKIYNAYGPTETCVFVTAHMFTCQTAKNCEKMTIGKPLPNTDIYILDDNLDTCPCNTEGEIYISGHNVSSGYVNQLELTRQVFLPDRFHEGKTMYKTGDLGRYMADGNLECNGRIDSQIKLRGYRIELGDIQKHIEDIKGITQCVVQFQQNNHESFIAAYFTHNQDLSLSQIKNELKKNIPDYMIPSYFVSVKSFKLGISGKVDVSSLPDYKTYCLRDNNCKNSNIYDANFADPILEEFLSICKQVLDRDDAGLSDNFVNLGGSSLTMHLLLMKIWSRWGIVINIADIYKCDSLYEMYMCLKSGKIQAADREVYIGNDLQKTRITSVQHDMFSLKQVADAGEFGNKNASYSSFNIIISIHINEYLDCKKLEDALEKLTVRHNALRVTFSRSGAEWYMHLHEKCEKCAIKYVKTKERITRELLLENTMVFRETSLPLFQLVMFEDSEKQQVLMLNAHHAIFDFVSLQAFLVDLFYFYDNAGLPELSRGFFEYANITAKEDVRINSLFWREYMKNRPKAVLFSKAEPAFSHLSITEANKFDKINDEIKGIMLYKLRQTAVAYNATPYIVLLALLALYMRIRSGCRDIVIGTNLNGRETACDFGIIGMYTTQACIRIMIDDFCTLADLFFACRENVANVMMHQSISLSDIYKSQKMADMSKGALYHVFVNYIPVNTINFYRRGKRAVVEVLDEDPGFCPFELKFIENDDKISIEAKYLAEAIDKNKAGEILEGYYSLLNQLIDLPQSNVLLHTFTEGLEINESNFKRCRHNEDAASSLPMLAD